MKSLLEDAAGRAVRYLDNLDARGVAPFPEAVERLAELDMPLPDGSADPARTIEILDEIGSPATIASAGSRFFGFVIGGSLPVTLAANWLAAAWDQNSALYQVTPGTAKFEQVALNWMLELFGMPAEYCGAFVTGATVANFTALAAARHAVLARTGWDVEADGLIGAPPVTVVVGEEAHPSLIKSLGLLGLGRRRVQRVPVDDQGRMLASALPAFEGPTIVCTQVGNVNTGAFDPVGEICDRANDGDAWVHVDGAFGLWALAVPSLANLASGIEHAHSWATDFHKYLNVPYDSGLALVRDKEALQAAMAVTAEYLPTETPFRNPSDFVPELSRRSRGVEVWAALHALGRQGVIELVERTCRHARRFAEVLGAAGYEILNEVVLNQVLVSFGDAAETERVIAGVQTDGTCWCGGTVWHGKRAMRISVSSWATTDEDIERSLEAILGAARGS